MITLAGSYFEKEMSRNMNTFYMFYFDGRPVVLTSRRSSVISGRGWGAGRLLGGNMTPLPSASMLRVLFFKCFLLNRICVFKLLPMAYIDSLLSVDKEHYLRKLNTIGIYSCPCMHGQINDHKYSRK